MLLPSESISTATPTSSEIAVYGFLHPPPPPPRCRLLRPEERLLLVRHVHLVEPVPRCFQEREAAENKLKRVAEPRARKRLKAAEFCPLWSVADSTSKDLYVGGMCQMCPRARILAFLASSNE